MKGEQFVAAAYDAAGVVVAAAAAPIAFAAGAYAAAGFSVAEIEWTLLGMEDGDVVVVVGLRHLEDPPISKNKRCNQKIQKVFSMFTAMEFKMNFYYRNWRWGSCVRMWHERIPFVQFAHIGQRDERGVTLTSEEQPTREVPLGIPLGHFMSSKWALNTSLRVTVQPGVERTGGKGRWNVVHLLLLLWYWS